MMNRNIEMLAGITLENEGISLPLHTVLRRKPFRVTMKIPSTRSLIRASRRYLKIGVTPDEYDAYSHDQVLRFIAHHGVDVSRIVAYGIVRGPILGRLLNRPVAWILRELMTPGALAAAWRQVLNITSTTSFGIIIASAAALNKMQPLASQNGSENDRRS